MEFVHSNFTDYVEQVKKELPDDLNTITGELRSQEDGWMVYVSEHSILPHLYQTVECPL